ncbi:MAG: hypothetical protein WEA34_11570, partial [Gemmatimonadota bacterium]
MLEVGLDDPTTKADFLIYGWGRTSMVANTTAMPDPVSVPELHVEPREIRPQLEVAKIGRRERLPSHSLIEKRSIPRVNEDLMMPVGVEKGPEKLFTLLPRESTRCLARGSAAGGARHRASTVDRGAATTIHRRSGAEA